MTADSRTAIPKLYRPANGSEGDRFESQFCDRCIHDREWRELTRNPCDIHTRALAFGTNDEDYPTEWRYGDDGKPTCTAFQEDS